MSDDILNRLKQGLTVPDEDMPRESTPRERRRYAVLQGAVTLVAGHYPYVSLQDLIGFTEAVLAEIERRESRREA